MKPLAIPMCPGCKQPAHASESDDDNYHDGCRPFSRAGQYIVIDGERDDHGRASFTMFWSDPDGVDNPSPQQIPRKRAQCFRAVPEEYTKHGAVIVKTEAEAKRLAWGK